MSSLSQKQLTAYYEEAEPERKDHYLNLITSDLIAAARYYVHWTNTNPKRLSSAVRMIAERRDFNELLRLYTSLDKASKAVESTEKLLAKLED